MRGLSKTNPIINVTDRDSKNLQSTIKSKIQSSTKFSEVTNFSKEKKVPLDLAYLKSGYIKMIAGLIKQKKIMRYQDKRS